MKPESSFKLSSMVRGRGATFALLGGMFVGILVVGLALPFAFGEAVGSPGVRLDASASGSTSAGGGAVTAPSTRETKETAASAAATPTTAPEAAGTMAATSTRATTATTATTSVVRGALTASDTGVTATTVKIGFALITSGLAERFGFALDIPTEDEQRSYWQANVDQLNRRGGINGRRIEPVYRAYDSSDAAQARALCLAFTEDEDVFAVAGPIVQPSDHQCITTEGKTPLVTLGIDDDELFSSGLLVTIRPRTSRLMRNFAAELERLKLLRRADVGILGSERWDPRGKATKLLTKLVDEAGAASSHVEMISADRGTAATQIPVVVNKWRAAGVDTIVFVSDPLDSINFVNEAESQAWFPKYATSDFANGATNDTAVAGQGRSFDGAVGITTTRHGEISAGLPASPASRGCDQRYTEGSGKAAPSSKGKHLFLWQTCDQFDFLVAGARAAGPHLTRAAWSQSMQRLGAVPSAVTGGGSFQPGKLDFSDFVREVRFEYDCRCWRASGNFRPGRS